jgi:hypothetical protein
MKTIYKYTLNIEDEPILLLPAGAQILSVNSQETRNGEKLFLWALVDPETKETGRYFRIYGTGHPIDEADLSRLRFIGTVSMRGGALIWHVFENVLPMDTFPAQSGHLN